MADINPMIPMSMNYGTSPFIQSADIRRSLAASDAQNLETAIKLDAKRKYNTAQSIIKKHLKDDGTLDPIGATKELYAFSPEHADMFVKEHAEHMANELKGLQQTGYVKLHPTASKMLEQTVGESNWPGRPIEQPQSQQQAVPLPGLGGDGNIPPVPEQVAPQAQPQQPYQYQAQMSPQQNAEAYGNASGIPDPGLIKEQQITAGMGMDPNQINQNSLGVPSDGSMGPNTSTLGQMVGGSSASIQGPVAQQEVIPEKPTVNRLTTDLSGIISGTSNPATVTPKQRDYIDRWLEYAINPAREALSNIEPALSVKDNASALYKASAATNKDPSLTPNQKLKYAEWTEDQWQKFFKYTTPLSGSSRNALGIAGISNVRAQRAIQMFSDPSVIADPQMMSLAMDDVMYIFRGGVPTEHSQEAATYKNAQTWLSNFFQMATANPQLLNSPGTITQVQNVLKSILEVDNKVIDRNLSGAKPAFQRIIDDDVQNNGGKRAEAFYSGLLGTKELGTEPVASPEQRFSNEGMRLINEAKAIALSPNSPDAERISAERYLDKKKVTFREKR